MPFKLDWENASVNMTEQKVYVKVDGGAEELVATVGPDIRTYTDLTERTIVDNIEYSVESVGYVKGQSTVSRSAGVVHNLVTPPEPMLVKVTDTGAMFGSVSPLKVDWGDGVVQEVADNTTQPFGTYTLNLYQREFTETVSDRVITIGHLDGVSPIQLIVMPNVTEVVQWWGSGYAPIQYAELGNVISFQNASLVSVPDHAPPNTTNIGGLFSAAQAFNQDISNWDVSNVTGMDSLFYSAMTFNQPLDQWDVSNVTDMKLMFAGATAFSHDLSTWCVTNITTTPESFSTQSGLTNEQLPVWGTCPIPTPMIVKPSAATINISSTSPLTIDWGDGVVQTTFDSDDADLAQDGVLSKIYTHTYTNGFEDKQITISHVNGTSPIEFIYSDAVSEITQWWWRGYKGVNIADVGGLVAFYGWGSDLITVPDHAPPNTTTIAMLFRLATAFNQDISTWNVSKVTDMRAMFAEATSFNSDISNWDVSKVTDMSYMFNGATSFNQDISTWDVSNVVNMSSMFFSSTTFNQPIGVWNTYMVKDMSNMFYNTSTFNQDISQWCVGEIAGLPSNFSSHSALTPEQHPVWGTCPRGENIIPDEMIFTTTAGEINYYGQRGDVITLSDGTTINHTAVITTKYTVPAGKHKVKLVQTRDETTLLYGASLVELNQFPTISTVKRFKFAAGTEGSPNLIRVPETLPPSIFEIGNMFGGATSFNQDISMWDTSHVTNMEFMFTNATSFNQNLNTWDTSNVISFRDMFHGATAFNGDISSWNTGNSTQFLNMFKNATAFNQPIGNWDISKATTLEGMFQGASSFNQPIGNWNPSNVTSVYNMFTDATVFNQDLSQWCVPKITPPVYSFGATALAPEYYPVWGTCPVRTEDDEIPSNEMHFTTLVGNINYHGVVGDQLVFSDGTTVTLDEEYLSDITVPSGKHKVVLAETRSQSYVGLGGEALVELHNFPTLSSVDFFNTYPNNPSPNLVKVPTVLPSNITSLGGMFDGATSFNQDISAWDTSNVTDMGGMFYNATSFDQDISDWDVSSVTNMSNIFHNAVSFNQPLNSWNVSNVTHMIDMFSSAISFNQDIGNWDVSNVINMAYMFWGATSFNQDLFKWNTSNVIDMGGMFLGATSFNQDLSQWCVSNITSLPYEFDDGATNWTLPRPVWGTCPVKPEDDEIPSNEMYFTTTEGTIYYAGNQGDQILLSDGTTYTVSEDGSYSNENVPAGKHKVKLVTERGVGYVGLGGEALVELHNFPTLVSITTFDFYPNTPSPNLVKVPTVLPSNITSLNQMFYGATSFNQDISMWDTSNVTVFSQVFAGCNLFNQPLTGWNTSNGTNLRAMFDRCFVFNQPVNHFVTSNCTDFGYMFNACSVFNQDLSNFDTSKATKMDGMFRLAKLFNYPLNHFVTTDVTTFDLMFASAFAFNQPLDTWDTSNATNMDSMFSNASKFNQDISGWNVKGVTTMDSMFYYAKAFTGNLSQWCVTNITSTPANFATSAAAFTKPVWGTCPRGEDQVTP